MYTQVYVAANYATQIHLACEGILYDRKDAARKVLYRRVVIFLERKTSYETEKEGKKGKL